MTFGSSARSIITTMIGTAITALMTALQESALMGSIGVKSRATPPNVASAMPGVQKLDHLALVSTVFHRIAAQVRRIEEESKRHLENFLHLTRIGTQSRVGVDHRHHRSDAIPADRIEAVEKPQRGYRRCRQANLLLAFAQGGGDGIGIVRPHPATGEGNLAGVLLQGIRSHSEDQPLLGVVTQSQ